MLYSQLKPLCKQLSQLGFDYSERREIVSEMESSDDFEACSYRFIDSDSIDRIMRDELTSDIYVLGCVADWFAADMLELPIDVIQLMQKSEAFEAIGTLLARDIETVQEAMVRSDGYGSHFGRYDGNEHELRIPYDNDKQQQYWHAFRVD
jgi:hypothetical protein